jgi:hypothetical protein
MRMFNDGDTITIEPFRAGAFPVEDLVVDRSAFDRIQHAGGFISVNTSGNPVDANAIPINKRMLTLLLMQRLVFVVVWLLVRTLRCCLWRKSIPVRFVTSR